LLEDDAEGLGDPLGSLEPGIIASAMFAAWRAPVFGFGQMVEVGLERNALA
jgi:hypothetical protein